jgi:hypothetical protein
VASIASFVTLIVLSKGNFAKMPAIFAWENLYHGTTLQNLSGVVLLVAWLNYHESGEVSLWIQPGHMVAQ